MLPAIPFPSALRLALVVLVALVGGVMNAIAGGGTLLTFPALIALGIPPIVANATSTVALWPGAVSSMWGYRSELAGASRWAAGFALPSLVGGYLGARLLLATSPGRFAALVPWLVLGATALFIAQGPTMTAIRRRQRRLDPDAAARAASPAALDAERDAALTRHYPPPRIVGYQFLVSVYGGYFGAGVGILMLAALGFMGLSNIHRMNGLKNWGGLCMNLVAAVTFAASALVNWPVALAMAVGALTGGYVGSRVAQRVGQRAVRSAIVVIGLGSGVWLLVARM